jgi:hypothetical protein
MATELKNERYRYLNENITQLNGYANARLIAYVSIIAGWITVSSVLAVVDQTRNILWLVSSVFLIQQIADFWSWWAYRKEQNSIDPAGTKPPSLAGFLRWKETYVVLLYVLVPFLV